MNKQPLSQILGTLLYLLSTICVNRSYIWIWPHYAIKKRDALGIIRFFIKLQIDDILNKLSEWLWAEATKRLWGCGHLLLTDKEPFIFSLQEQDDWIVETSKLNKT